jgi:hypothetical protein
MIRVLTEKIICGAFILFYKGLFKLQIPYVY